MSPLTPKQKLILDFIRSHIRDKGYAPSQREIAETFGFRSLGTVQNYLVRLEREGFLTREWNARRGLRVSGTVARGYELPLAGTVAAGKPIEAIETSDTIEVPSSMAGTGENFVLRVKGSSMIEDGILVGYLHDRQNARLMDMKPTGNGRRESFAHSPMPRMTNTLMEAGDHDPAEIIASVEKGLYAVNFGGGQVDITSGKFVFSASEAYLIENGKIGAPVKGASLIGNGPDVLTRVAMVGGDLALDPGVGTCGKNGQGVPVGVGQPTLLIDGLTVGGTAA